MPATVVWHEIVALPDPVTVGGLIAPHVSPDGTLSEIDTLAEKWFSPVTVIVEVVDTPTSAAAGEVEDTAKSRNWKRAVVDCTSEPAVAVIVSV